MLFRLGWILASFLFIACGSPEKDWSFPVTARIVSSVNGEYALREVTYETLVDLPRMSGTIGALEGGAILNLSDGLSEVIKSDNPREIYERQGRSVKLDFIVENGVVIPKNFKSMEMLGLYYAYERTVLYWRDQLGVDFDVIGYPKVYYNPSLRSSVGGLRTDVVLLLNAAYLAGVKDFWYFKTSAREKLPVKMNFGVVAHEFGHFIFDYYFADFNHVNYENNSSTNTSQLNGINEGLSDFFSYVVTSSVQEFGASLDQLAEFRTLPVDWTMLNLNASGCTGGFYCKGSILASALYQIANEVESSPNDLALKVLEALPLFREDWLRHRDSSTFDYHFLLNRLIELTSANKREGYCDILKVWFDAASVLDRLLCD